jgi:hypothetical protein
MIALLTDRQKRFALEYASNGGNATAAAKAAGYSSKSAHEQGRQNLEIPHVQEAIHKELMRQRFRSGAIGLEAMIQIATNEKAPPAARVSAARSLLEHAGMVGTAKEVLDNRADADNQAGEGAIDYKQVLAQLGEYNKAKICPVAH